MLPSIQKLNHILLVPLQPKELNLQRTQFTLKSVLSSQWKATASSTWFVGVLLKKSLMPMLQKNQFLVKVGTEEFSPREHILLESLLLQKTITSQSLRMKS